MSFVFCGVMMTRMTSMKEEDITDSYTPRISHNSNAVTSLSHPNRQQAYAIETFVIAITPLNNTTAGDANPETTLPESFGDNQSFGSTACSFNWPLRH